MITGEASKAAVEVHGLVKEYPRPRGVTVQHRAIDDVSFSVPKGSFFTLLGPSGCGKSTTLRCLAGRETANNGLIKMGGNIVFSASEKKNVSPERRPIAMVPQSYGIWPHMTVFDNAAFPLKYGRMQVATKDVKERTMTILDQVGLKEYAHRWSSQLSGGQQQRLALARALLCEPELLLLDEPLSNLDAKLRGQLRGELRSFQQQFGVTTVYVTHDQSEALAMSDYIVVMSQGKIEQLGSPTEIYESPASKFVADFVGSANLISGRSIASDSSTHTVDTAVGALRCERSGALPENLNSEQFDTMLCIRPEHVLVEKAPSGSILESAPNRIPGTVTSAEYLGDRKELIIDLGQGITVRSQTSAQLNVWSGDEVVVTLDPEWSIVLWS